MILVFFCIGLEACIHVTDGFSWTNKEDPTFDKRELRRFVDDAALHKGSHTCSNLLYCISTLLQWVWSYAPFKPKTINCSVILTQNGKLLSHFLF